jgi:hypothetical protein
VYNEHRYVLLIDDNEIYILPAYGLAIDHATSVQPMHSDFIGESHVLSDLIVTTIEHDNDEVDDDDDDVDDVDVVDDDHTQDSSLNDVSEGEESADNGEIDLVQEFESSQTDPSMSHHQHLWTTGNRDVFIIQDDDILSAVVTHPSTIIHRTQPTSIMKLTANKSMDSIHDQQMNTSLKPKVRFNLDPEYEREREWNKVNKLLGNSVEWTDEFEV